MRTPLAWSSLAAPLALAVAGATTAVFTTDQAAKASLVFLSLVAAACLSPLALTAGARSRIVPAAVLASFAALVLLPWSSPLPSAVSAVVLVAALGFELAERARAGTAGEGGSIFALAAAAQLLARADRVFLADRPVVTLAEVVAPAAIVAAALAVLARRRPSWALALGLASFAGGPGWGLLATSAVATTALLLSVPALWRRPPLAALVLVAGAGLPSAVLGPPWLAIAVAAGAAVTIAPTGALRRAGAGVLAAAALLALLASALPWRRARPLETALAAALSPPFAVVARPIERRAVVLTRDHPRIELPVAVAGGRAATLISYLTNATALPCATPVAELTLIADGREQVRVALRSGRDTAEWAAERADVRVALACPAPAPAWSWIPAAGRFFGSTYRARLDWGRPVRADRIRLERSPALPERTAVAVFGLEVER